jgi:pilus assembly protein CpaE
VPGQRLHMASNSKPEFTTRRSVWPWQVGLVIDTPELIDTIRESVTGAGGTILFEFPGSASTLEISSTVERSQPDVLFVEFAGTGRTPADWMMEVRRHENKPLVAAVHPVPEPEEMIAALRAGASEFITAPIATSMPEAMERLGTLLESIQTQTTDTAPITGVLSAKGGCGATTLICHLAAALRNADPRIRTLIADLDHQAPGARYLLRLGASPGKSEGPFAAVRRLSSNSWREFVTEASPGIDLLTSSEIDETYGGASGMPEQWRVESLFRFVSKQYGRVLVDLGRNLNPSNWVFLQCVDELHVVTMPDVLALFQTRSMLQTLAGRGFDKRRIKIILNRNQASPRDFWVESIEQMFEMPVFAVIPSDTPVLQKLPQDSFQFPVDTNFGRALSKLAVKLSRPTGPGSQASKRSEMQGKAA